MRFVPAARFAPHLPGTAGRDAGTGEDRTTGEARICNGVVEVFVVCALLALDGVDGVTVVTVSGLGRFALFPSRLNLARFRSDSSESG